VGCSSPHCPQGEAVGVQFCVLPPGGGSGGAVPLVAPRRRQWGCSSPGCPQEEAVGVQFPWLPPGGGSGGAVPPVAPRRRQWGAVPPVAPRGRQWGAVPPVAPRGRLWGAVPPVAPRRGWRSWAERRGGELQAGRGSRTRLREAESRAGGWGAEAAERERGAAGLLCNFTQLVCCRWSIECE